MKSLFTALLLCLLTLGNAQAEEIPQLRKEGKQAFQALGKGLKTEMKKAMKKGGPLAAIGLCKAKASPITAQISKQQGMTIRRTSLQLRNPLNAPNAWEKSVLEEFAQRHQKGEGPQTMLRAEIFEHEGKRVFRMMKAIPLRKACLHCHGDHITPKVASRLKKLYPQDQATGYREGQIRGAFSLEKKL